MEIQLTKKFNKLLQKLPDTIINQAIKSVRLFKDNPAHPSLEYKKMAGYEDIYEIRVNVNYRITCQKIGDTVILRKIGTHDLLLNP